MNFRFILYAMALFTILAALGISVIERAIPLTGEMRVPHHMIVEGVVQICATRDDPLTDISFRFYNAGNQPVGEILDEYEVDDAKCVDYQAPREPQKVSAALYVSIWPGLLKKVADNAIFEVYVEPGWEEETEVSAVNIRAHLGS